MVNWCPREQKLAVILQLLLLLQVLTVVTVTVAVTDVDVVVIALTISSSPHLSWLTHLVEIIMILLYFIILLVGFSDSSVPYPCQPQQLALYVLQTDHQPFDVITYSVYCVEQSMQVE